MSINVSIEDRARILATALSIFLTACGGGSGGEQGGGTGGTGGDGDSNSAPVFTSAGSASVEENNIDTGYTATAEGPDGDNLAYGIIGGADRSQFLIDETSGVISFASAPDFDNPGDSDGDNVYLVTLGVEDGKGNSASLDVAVTVTDIDEPPRFTSAAAAAIPEGRFTAYAAKAVDDEGDPIVYAVTGGTDRDLFAVDSSTGALSFKAAPDFENPADADGQNDYAVEISATDDDGGIDSLAVTVTVADANDPPQFVSADSVGVHENAVATGYNAAAVDQDGDSIVYSRSGGPDKSLFNINPSTGELRFNIVPDYESPADADGDNHYVVELRANDGNGGFATRHVTVSVADVDRQLQLQVSYPTPNANLGGVDQVTVSGNVVDLESDIGFDDVTAIRVNGQPAVRDIDTPSRWSLQIPVARPRDTLEVSVEWADGGVDNITQPVENMPVWIQPESVALTEGNQALVVDYRSHSLFTVDLDTGERALVAAGSNDADSVLVYPVSVDYDAVNDRALVMNGSGALVWVDLTSGAVTVISDAGDDIGVGDDFKYYPSSVVLDSNNNRALVSGYEELVSVDLASGDRKVISDENRGSGPKFSRVRSVVLDAENERAIVVDSYALLAVDLVSGDRTVIADNSTGTGAYLSGLRSVVKDPAANRALVASFDSLMWINLSNGDRTVISDADQGVDVDPAFRSLSSVALDGATGWALALDVRTDALLSIDLASGVRTVVSDTSAGSGPGFIGPVSISGDMINNRILVADGNLSALVSFDLASGNRTVVSGFRQGVGTGPDFVYPNAVTSYTTDSRALVAGWFSLMSVDLISGERAVVSDRDKGAGPEFDGLQSVVPDEDNGRALVIDKGLKALLSVDLIGGGRTVISNADIGDGPYFANPRSIVLDADGGRALVVDDGSVPLLSVDLASGDRVVVSNSYTDLGPVVGDGPSLSSPESITLDAVNNRAFVVNAREAILTSVDLASGDRTIISHAGPYIDPDVGVGPRFSYPNSVILDAANNRVFVSDSNVGGVFVVNLDTGDRALASR